MTEPWEQRNDGTGNSHTYQNGRTRLSEGKQHRRTGGGQSDGDKRIAFQRIEQADDTLLVVEEHQRDVDVVHPVARHRKQRHVVAAAAFIVVCTTRNKNWVSLRSHNNGVMSISR